MDNYKYNEAIKNGIKILLEASDYLASCGDFSSVKFDRWQAIMLRNPFFEQDTADRDARLAKEFAAEHAAKSGTPIWEKVKWSLEKKLGENLNVYLKHLVEDNPYPDADTAAFYKWARSEIFRIGAKMDGNR